MVHMANDERNSLEDLSPYSVAPVVPDRARRVSGKGRGRARWGAWIAAAVVLAGWLLFVLVAQPG